MNPLDFADQIDMTAFISNPGVDVYSFLKEEAERTYIAYKGRKQFVEKELRQHPREEDAEFQVRKSIAYSFRYTSWGTKFLTKTLNSKKYPVERSFQGAFADLSEIAKRTPASGKTFDARLKEATKEALLGGISYIYVDINEERNKTLVRSATTDPIAGAIEFLVLRVSQVSHLLFTADGYISQCIIQFKENNNDTVIRYYNGFYDAYRYDSANGKLVTLVPKTVNPIGIAPLVPVCFDGGFDEPDMITSAIQSIVPIDVSIMNDVSDSKRGFSLFNFPYLALGRPMGGIDQFNSGIMGDGKGNDGMGNKKNPEDDVTVSPAKGFFYNVVEGEPKLLEPKNSQVDKTLQLVEFQIKQIAEILGIGNDEDHALASGVSKMFSFQDTNDTLRNIHSVCQDVDYQIWYVIALLKASTSPDRQPFSFEEFKDNVSINHPTSFDPTGGQLWKRLNDVIKNGLLVESPDEIQKQFHKQYYRTLFKETMSDEQIDDLVEKSYKEFSVNAARTEHNKSVESAKLAGRPQPATGGTKQPKPRKSTKSANKQQPGQPAKRATD